MKKYFQFLTAGFVFMHTLFSAWYVLHGEINFISDIARDFFLFDEIVRKKIVLIGPNSSSGLFHGPLWSYLNVPAYIAGNGDPVIVGYFWVFLSLTSVVIGFLAAKKIFDRNTACLFAILYSQYLFFHTWSLYNPHGLMFLIIPFFWLYISFLKSGKFRYLLLLFLTNAAMIQFQMAVGIPMLLLTAVPIIRKLMKTKKYVYILSYTAIPVFLGNFIVFDIRHDGILAKLLRNYLGSGGRDSPDYPGLLLDRLHLLFSSPEILRADPGNRNLLLFLLLLAGIFLQIKQKRFRQIYLHFLYLYTGFFFLSLFNTGPLLYFYLFPLFPLVFLMFSSLITSKYTVLFLTVFSAVYVLNTNTVLLDIENSKNTVGKSIYSWNFLHAAARKVYEGPDKEFGFFVYAPNTFAYEGRYAMKYTASEFPQKKASEFQKKAVTYLFIAPPPPDNPYMFDAWWTKNKVRIDKKPDEIIRFENGYKIEKYRLIASESAVPAESDINVGIFFR